MSAHDPLDRTLLVQLANDVLTSPQLLRQLSDRVYALLQDELRDECDRSAAPYRRL